MQWLQWPQCPLPVGGGRGTAKEVLGPRICFIGFLGFPRILLDFDLDLIRIRFGFGLDLIWIRLAFDLDLA